MSVQHNDVIGLDIEKNEKMASTAHRGEEEEEKHESATASSAASSIHEGENEHHDLEATATVSTNSPPYSVFTKKQKYLIVCELDGISTTCARYTNLTQSLLHGVVSSLPSVQISTSQP